MSSTAIPYRKLPGTGWNPVQDIRLYLGRDHILQVTTLLSQQTYKRFYFIDIQAIQVHRTHWGKLWNVGWAAGTVFWAWIAWAVGGVAAWIFESIAALFFLGLLVNLARGPTVATHIQTAVQTNRLRSLVRLRKAERVLAELGPLIVAAQASARPIPSQPRSASEPSPVSEEAGRGGAPPSAASPSVLSES